MTYGVVQTRRFARDCKRLHATIAADQGIGDRRPKPWGFGGGSGLATAPQQGRLAVAEPRCLPAQEAGPQGGTESAGQDDAEAVPHGDEGRRCERATPGVGGFVTTLGTGPQGLHHGLEVVRGGELKRQPAP